MNIEKNVEELRQEVVKIAVENKDDNRLWLMFAAFIAGAIKGRAPGDAEEIKKGFSGPKYLACAREVRDFLAENPGDLTAPDAREMYFGALHFLDEIMEAAR